MKQGERIFALMLTSRQAAALAKMIRLQAAAWLEAELEIARPDEIFTKEDLEAVLPLLGGDAVARWHEAGGFR